MRADSVVLTLFTHLFIQRYSFIKLFNTVNIIKSQKYIHSTLSPELCHSISLGNKIDSTGSPKGVGPEVIASFKQAIYIPF